MHRPPFQRVCCNTNASWTLHVRASLVDCTSAVDLQSCDIFAACSEQEGCWRTTNPTQIFKALKGPYTGKLGHI